MGKSRFKILRDAANHITPVVGEWAYDMWAELNEEYFEKKLKVGGIQWSLTRYGHLLGFYDKGWNRITLHESLVVPRSESPWFLGPKLGPLFARDVLFHEMIHQGINQHWRTFDGVRRGESSHNNTWWASEINRLLPMIGATGTAKVVRPRRVNGKVARVAEDGCLPLKEFAAFPEFFRPTGYYRYGKDAKEYEELKAMVLKLGRL